MKKKKICLAASTGGHYEQISRLSKLEKDYFVCYFTNKTPVSKKREKNTFHVHTPSQKHKIIKIFGFLINGVQSFFYLLFKQPKLIISTGSGEMYPLLWLGKKIFHKKIIFIESYAKVKTPNKCGLAVYKFADVFIIQWPELQSVYPNAKYYGGIY